MSGHLQPADQPDPSDWELLYQRAVDFYQAAPWTRWHDGIVLVLVLVLVLVTSKATPSPPVR